MTIENIASIAHEANRQHCKNNGSEVHISWDECSQEHRDRMIAGVIWNLENPFASQSDQHDQWMKKMEADGWVYGENGRDEVAKTHHCLVPYADLPGEQRAKDALFKGIVASLREYLGEMPS